MYADTLFALRGGNSYAEQEFKQIAHQRTFAYLRSLTKPRELEIHYSLTKPRELEIHYSCK